MDHSTKVGRPVPEDDAGAPGPFDGQELARTTREKLREAREETRGR